MRGSVWKRAMVASATSAAVLAIARAAHAQPPAREHGGFRYVVEGYLAQYQLADRLATATKQDFGGFGLRVAFNPPDPDRAARSLVDRAAGSLFATYTTKQGTPDVSTLHVGLQTDFSILPRPLGGHLDPFFGLSLGIFRTSRENIVNANGRVNHSDLALSPGAGVRIPFFNGVGLRGDVRAPLVFGTSTTASVVYEGGLYLSF